MDIIAYVTVFEGFSTISIKVVLKYIQPDFFIKLMSAHIFVE